MREFVAFLDGDADRTASGDNDVWDAPKKPLRGSGLRRESSAEEEWASFR